MWLTQLLDRNVQCFPDRAAVVDRDRSLTWTAFRERTSSVARGLAAMGIRRGDRVAILSRDRVEVMESYFALARLGALFVPVNHSLTPTEVTGIVERTGAVAVIGESLLLERHPDLPVRWRIALDGPQFTALGDGGGPHLPPVPDDAPAAILHTSATTGQAKGVTVDHASFRAIALGWLAAARPTDDMVLVNCCPLYHGSMVVSLTYMAAGATLVLVPGFKPQTALAAIADNQATHIWLVPQMLRFLLRAKSLDGTDLSSLREVLYGAAPMPADLYAEAAESLGCGFRQVYGMTEVGGPFVTLGPDEHPAPEHMQEVLPSGRVIPGMSVRVLDPHGAESATGGIGEIHVRGPGVMQGYWGDEAATRAVTVDGWTRTGDLGFLDEEGRIHLVDRMKDLIIRAGLNVYPMEVERALHTHPAVLDEAVIGVPDEDYGEVPVAFVVADGSVDESDLMRHLVGRLAPYKRPRRIEFVSTVPRNPAGKILKKLLRT
ncbi:class I adenylate-forming enzyme family protein [Kitasatospora kifunensis]|uniref:Acyl-CoA synthetase (AMP-forming)/AMP-acid ligase II n=1 Tax=Kitasatospora kifunensis TaxID=58351 RepID=A0A7W7W025_KITKI|nr:AMP-binding protein [Kitasatospora kifunensis]MBB4928230.1 acyl-CoA synthetase (AMP-forming)/AMP-acid ligase II [Kitasatospora kifunensis]